MDWDCLLEVLRNRDFGHKWIDWIYKWLHSTKMSVLINGEVGKEIVSKKGHRQEDPLFLLLFVMGAEGLKLLFKCMEDAGRIKGLLGVRSVVFTNLQYGFWTL